jgi:hypothetical protein
MEGRASWSGGDTDKFVRQVDRWRAVGASHIDIDTMYSGLATVDDHIAAITRAAELVGLG